jgi:flagellar L-ring protein precursor FlgH
MKPQQLVIASTVTLALTNAVGAQPPGQPGQGPYNNPYGAPSPMIDPDAEGLTVAPPNFGVPPGPIPPRPLRRRDLSWIYIDRPRPRKLAVHDIITVIVDEKSESTQNTRFNRQRNVIFNAILREFIRINSKGNLDTAAPEAPGIQAQLQSQMQSYGQGLSQEGLKYRIAATVVDILPNGTLVLEARKSILTNDALWEYSLTGKIRTQDVAGNNTVHSENVADLKISKRENGKIPDSTKRGFFTKLYDWFLVP